MCIPPPDACCIYCRLRPPKVRLTESDIIPVSLRGGALLLDGLVCDPCNRKMGQVEQRVRRNLAFFLDGFGIRGNSDQPPVPEAELVAGDLRFRMRLDPDWNPTNIQWVKRISEEGKEEIVLVVPPGEDLQKRVREIARRPGREGYRFREFSPDETPPEPFIEGTLPAAYLAESDMRRLAAKVALETLVRGMMGDWWYRGSHRTPSLL